MTAHAPEYQNILFERKSQAVAPSYSDLEYLRTFELFQPERGMSRIFKKASELLVNSGLDLGW